jgi:putative FmdB family regulatory protein
MPLYVFSCDEHGEFEVFQDMNEEHNANCGVCGKAANRVYCSPQLKCQDSNYGYTQEEIADNLAKDGKMEKDWRKYYER